MTQFVEAVAHVLAAVAWPAVIVAGALRFEKQIIALAGRLEEWRGVKFGQPPSQAGAPAPSTLATSAATSQVLIDIPRTPATRAMMEQLRNAPFMTTVPSEQREEALLVLLARVGLIALFQNAELFIWGSQIALLQHLNARPSGDSRENLARTFYDPSGQQFPDLYRNYPFDEWLTFLVRTNLVVISAAGTVSITDQGREYLGWRVEARRPPTLAG